MRTRLLVAALLLAAACRQEENPRAVTAFIQLDPGLPATRAQDPDEQLISDYNLLIFNAFGVLEEKVYIPRRQLRLIGGKVVHQTTLLKDVPYSIYAAANLGYELPCRTLEEVQEYRYHLAYPDEYSRGVPMAGRLEETPVGHSGTLSLPMERLMARVDLTIDRSELDADVTFKVEEVVVGGCPSSALLFRQSRAEGATQTFVTGFTKTGRQADALNRDVKPGVSGTVGLYLLENCQGDLLENVLSPEGRVFTEGRYRDICSYIEIRASYQSAQWTSQAGSHLIYRFYLGESLNNLDVHRNTLYSVTVKPQGDGLRETSWRVDKSGLTATKGSLNLHPAAYNECAIGDSFRIWCDVVPPETPFYMEALAHDDDPEVAKLYSYTVDPDGHGLTIHTWKGGTAVIYFKAGPPVDRDTLAMLVIK